MTTAGKNLDPVVFRRVPDFDREGEVFDTIEGMGFGWWSGHGYCSEVHRYTVRVSGELSIAGNVVAIETLIHGASISFKSKAYL